MKTMEYAVIDVTDGTIPNVRESTTKHTRDYRRVTTHGFATNAEHL